MKPYAHKTVLLVFVILFIVSSSQGIGQEQWPCFMHDVKHSGMAMSLGPKTPELEWVYHTDGEVPNSPVIDSGGRIYIGADKFYCLNPDGSEAFTFVAQNDISSTAAVSENLGVFFGSYDHYFYWLTTDGEFVAKFDTDAYNDGPPTIGTDGSIYFGSRSESFYAFRSDGTLNWSYDAYDWIVSAPAIADDGTVYVGADDRRLYAFAPFGELKWSYKGYDWISGATAIGPDGMIYVPCWDNTITSIDPEYGEVVWQYEVFDDIRSSPALFPDGSMYFGSYDKYLYCVSHEGRTRWSFDVGSEVHSSCALDLDGNCYFGAFDGRLYSLDSAGAMRWTFETESDIVSSPALDASGTLYFGTLDGAIYAIGGGSTDYTPRVGLHINKTTYTLDDTMFGFYYIINPMHSTLEADVYLALWTGNELLYYPTFSTTPGVFDANVCVESLSTKRSGTLFEYRFDDRFPYPQCRWYIGITEPGTFDFVGDIYFVDWEYEWGIDR